MKGELTFERGSKGLKQDKRGNKIPTRSIHAQEKRENAEESLMSDVGQGT